ncbi:hypothetical protein GBAR_LOCUS8964 [Geodia barretti]|uniref:Uncharacterized protein n=1 Tax=Geodia barretti TaxID=519541 RepID=A0AA35RMP8_GEOBA|nr:hypothetical protein GBAR_LOCUS8964 [Geodia barretti]
MNTRVECRQSSEPLGKSGLVPLVMTRTVVNIVQQLYIHFYLPLLSLANFHVPAKDNVFDDVIFTEIYGQAANKIIQQYKDDALGLPSFPQNKRPRYDRYDRPHSGTPGRFGPPRGQYGHPGGYGHAGGYRNPYGSGGGGGGGGYARGGGGYPPAGGYGGYRPMYPPYASPMYGGPPPPPRRGNFGYGPPSGSSYGGGGGGGRSPYGYGPPPSRGYYGRY